MSTLYIMCGIPGSGKTTLASNIPLSIMADEKLNIIESDNVRLVHLIGQGHLHVTHQNTLSDEHMSSNEKEKFEKEVWDDVRKQLIQKLNSGEDVVLDATNVEKWILEEWFDLIKLNLHKTKVIVMSTPLDICVKRNNAREAPVPEDVMQRMYNDYIMTIGWLYMEHQEKIINSEHL